MIWEMSTYHRDDGAEFEAVRVKWPEVENVLGRPDDSTPRDDHTLVEAQLASSAPARVRDASGWIDHSGWGLIGPDIEVYEDESGSPAEDSYLEEFPIPTGRRYVATADLISWCVIDLLTRRVVVDDMTREKPERLAERLNELEREAARLTPSCRRADP